MKRLLATLLALLAFCAFAQNLQPVPELTARVVDQTGTLDAIQRKGLEDKLAAFEASKGTQIAFLMVATTQPEDVASYANRVGNAWKIGRQGIGDGVLLVVAKDDRKIRIEVSKTLEGALPDLAAKQIIDDAITPRFRQGDFAGGLQAGADQIIARVSGEALPAPRQPAQRSESGAGFDWMDLAIFLFIGVPVVARALKRVLGRKFGAFATGAGVGTVALLITSSLVIAAIAAFIALVLSMVSGALPAMGGRRHSGWGGGPWIGTGGWGGGGGGWSGGGGGWSSGGGGDFGGGGASGEW